MAKPKRRASDGRLHISAIRGKTIADFAVRRDLGRKYLVALDQAGNVLFQFSPWLLMDGQGMFYATDRIRKEYP